MSYLVLARKWRPSTFDDVVGQEHVTRTLQNAIKQDRVAHALLFTGSRGVGKTTCARILARALNCEQGPTADPCGQCAACLDIIGGTSVDVFEIDGASNNGVEQIRELRESVKFRPTRGKRKMYIIDEVHMLTTAAFNALLKTLEEPPEHVIFVFATTEPHKIPDTIHSRCQRYDFKRIPERKIVAAIARIAAAEGLQVEEAALTHIAREAQGGMRDSLSLLDQVIAFCGNEIREAQAREVLGIADRKVLHDLTGAVLAGDGQTALQIIDGLFQFGLDLQKFAAELTQHVRDLMVVRVCAEPQRLVDLPEAEIGTMQALVADVHPARIHRLFGALLQGADEVGRSPFPKLVLEMTLLRLCEQGATLPLDEALDALARLEARLDQEVPPDGGGGAGGGAAGGGGAAPGRAAGGGGAPALNAPTARQTQAAPQAVAPAQTASVVPFPTHRPASPAPPGGARGTVVALMSAPQAAQAVQFEEAPELEAPAPEEVPVIDLDGPPPEARAEDAQAEDAQAEDAQAEDAQAAFEQEAAPPAPPSDEPLEPLDLADGRDAVAHFEHLARQLRRRAPFLAAELEQSARLCRFEPSGLHLVVPPGDHDALAAGRGTIADVLVKITGVAVPVDIEHAPTGDARLDAETLYARRLRLARERREARERAARQDPQVLTAVAIFGAEIEHVNPR